MRPTTSLLLLLLLSVLPSQAGHKPPPIILRVHVQTTGEGLPATMATTISLPPNGEQIQIRALPEATEHDLIDVQPNKDGTIRLFFDHQGQVNLNAATGDNQGRILVLLINGYVVYAPVIDEQITNGELDLPHPLNPEVVKLLQEVAKLNVKEAR